VRFTIVDTVSFQNDSFLLLYCGIAFFSNFYILYSFLLLSHSHLRNLPAAKTPVPQQFSYKQLVHSLLFGGGLFTSLAVPVLRSIVPWLFAIVCTVILASLLAVNVCYCRPSVFPRLRAECADYADAPPAETEYDVTNDNSTDEAGLLSSDALGGGVGDGDYLPPASNQ
jgi:hypothetical protein